MRRRCAAVIALAVTVACVSSCGSETATAPAVVVTSVAGTWDLTSVNARALPFTFQAADPRLDLLSKQFIISDAGTFSYSYSVKATDIDGTVTTTNKTDTGTDVLAANVVTFVFRSDGTTVTATVTNTTMTIENGMYSQAFTKR